MDLTTIIVQKGQRASYEDYVNLFFEHELHDAFTKFIVIYFGEAENANTRQVATRTLAPSSQYTDIASWKTYYRKQRVFF